MKYTVRQREDAAVAACAKWLETTWGKYYFSMTTHLPADDAEELRLLLQRAIRQSMSHAPNSLVTVEEVNRQFCNLLDSGKLTVLENRFEMCKRIDETNAAIAVQDARERQEQAEIARDLAAVEEFEKVLERRRLEDKANREMSIKDLRHAALFGKDRVNGHLKTTPQPPSVKIFSRSPKQ